MEVNKAIANRKEWIASGSETNEKYNDDACSGLK